MGADPSTAREHLFISYASEDAALAEWLTRKLTAEGYRVWCDRFKLLGGESYPKDIDLALKQGTFRVLALLSRGSMQKDNPVKERTLALNIGKERGIHDFLIPLNVDGLRATELDWMTSDITFISFNHGWADGLRQLLKKLDSITAPRPLDNGKEIAAHTFLPRDVLTGTPERLYSNCLPLTRMATAVLRFEVSPPTSIGERDGLLPEWPFFMVSPTVALALQAPPDTLASKRGITFRGKIGCDGPEILGIRTRNLLTFLLKASVFTRGLQRGLRILPNGRVLYFPQGVVANDRFRFRTYTGKDTSVLVSGERTLWRPLNSEKYRYYLAVEPRVRRDVISGYSVQITPTIFVTTVAGEPFPDRTVAARRKHLSKNWTNHEWLSRLFALIAFLAEGSDSIRLGGAHPDTEVVISAHPITFTAPYGINEEALDAEPEVFDEAASDAPDDPDEYEDDDA